MRLRYAPLAFAAAIGLAGCNDLAVTNPNAPDIDRILSTPDGIEAVFARSYQQVHNATHATSNALWPQTQVLSGESYATVANFGMAQRGGIPRQVIDNTRGNTAAAENNRDWSQLSRNARNMASAIRALDAFTTPERGGSLGSAAQNERARAFGFFSLGVALGKLSLMYDSVGVATHQTPSDEIPELIHYSEAMVVALAMLDSATAQATTAVSVAGNLTYPTDWLRTTGGGMTRAQFLQFVSSYKARFRAGVARTPEERAAVNWAQVVADASVGITADVILDLNANEGWSGTWLNQAAVASSWSQIPNLYIGMADTSNNYAAWVAAPITSGAPNPFLIHTPDTRFPSGIDRAAQLANSPADATVLPSVYFKGRLPGEDFPSERWGTSWYDHARFRHYRSPEAGGASVGPWVDFAKVENDMLWAEGLIRTNQAALAMPLINASRTAHGLPPFTDPAGRAPPHPGGSATSCVPRTPTGANRALECGTLLEAMKYEKRLETQFTGYAQWYVDHRGWGDLITGTTTQWPVPYQEMDARFTPFYNSQDAWRATSPTYGF